MVSAQYRSSICLFVCLQILNSFNTSGMDKVTLLKFGKWVEYGMVHPGMKNFPEWSGSRDPFKNFKPPSIFPGMDEAMLFKFGECVDYDKSHPKGTKFPTPKGAWSGLRGRFWDESMLFKFCKCIIYGECQTRS